MCGWYITTRGLRLTEQRGNGRPGGTTRWTSRDVVGKNDGYLIRDCRVNCNNIDSNAATPYLFQNYGHDITTIEIRLPKAMTLLPHNIA
jgi:hypothetical protein